MRQRRGAEFCEKVRGWRKAWLAAHPGKLAEYKAREHEKRRWQTLAVRSGLPMLGDGLSVAGPLPRRLSGWREDAAQDRLLAELERAAARGGR